MTSPLVLLAYGERVDVFFAGAEKVQKVQAGVFACLTGAQEDEIFFNPSGRRETLDGPAEPGKGFDCMFGVVVIPGDSVVVEKCEELVAVFIQSSFQFQGYCAQMFHLGDPVWSKNSNGLK